jgi:AraC family transcriptional regulator
VSPSQVRNNRKGTFFDLIPAITEEYIYQSDKARNQEPELVRLEQRILVGTAFFVPENTKIASLSKEWGQFMNEADLIPGRKAPQSFYQVQYWSENQELGGLYFYLGTEVENLKEVPPQFVVKIIPGGSYLRFIHRGLANKVGYTYRYIYHQFLPETDYRLTRPFNFEFYGEKCLGPDNENSESEIYIPVEVG